ncbi:MAG TPA: acyclic terpene utilization AtuA family protein [Xanthobacteraceae bacterium]|nr:acyclic terpene utilization AtuA family protein [Xanthobacteraceae bacterium]
MTADRIVRIGGASGFWGDSSVGAPQLIGSGKVDYLVFDYLAELTMSLLAAARMKNPALGYATDFVSVTMRAVLREAMAKKLRIVSNAGGMNPRACAEAIAAIAEEQGLDLSIAVVTGDDVMGMIPQLRQQGVREMQSGAAMPEKLVSANAYLGALPIARALDAGAEIVVTGRCVDSALALGVLVHEFAWSATDHDRLAQGSLVGHILECGCQATGGLHTDWDQVPDWGNIGYPIAECRSDGSFILTKPAGTGGLVTPATVGEQLLYEIGDPARYVLPDVVCDFTQVTMAQAGADAVAVSGARGRPPTPCYKVSATFLDGYRSSAQLTIVGFDAAGKARRTAQAILERTRKIFSVHNFGDYTDTYIETIGAESCYGPHARAQDAREVVMRLSVRHPSKDALDIFAREIAAAGTSWSPGTTGAGGTGRPHASPSIKQFAFLLEKRYVTPVVTIGTSEFAVEVPPGLAEEPASLPEHGADSTVAQGGDMVEVPLVRIAYGRSGDKGDTSNIGLIARSAALLPVLRREVTERRVGEWLGHLVHGRIARYDLPGIGAVNFVCEGALGGGGMASLRNDPLGKGMAQILLAMPVRVPRALLPD